MGLKRIPFVSLLRGARVAIALAAGLAIACIFENCFLPAPELPNTVREKMAHLSEHGNEYDAIFLGSSRIQNHVIPTLFDGLLAEKSVSLNSFNFGISSMHAPEDDYVLDLILAQPHARLRWVFIEIDFFNTSVQKDESGTERGLYWHDWPRMELLCRRLILATRSGLKREMRDAMERADDFFDHSRLFLHRSANAGRGAEILRRWLFQSRHSPLDWELLGTARDGWVPAVLSKADSEDKQSGSLGKFLLERSRKPPRKDESDSASQSILATTLSKIEKAGAIPVIVIPPRIRQDYYYPGPAIAARYPIADFCDPQKYPALYRDDLHVNRSHLNEAGAVVFTHLLAERFLQILAKK